MANQTKVELGLKQRRKESFRLGTQGFFGVIRSIHCNIKHSFPTTHRPAHRTAEMLKDYKIKAEQQKATSVQFLRRRLPIQ